MEHGFEPHLAGAVLPLSDAERALLISLGRQAIALLTERSGPGDVDPLAALVGIGVRDDVPEDPVLARLLPPGYAGESEAGEFRRFTEDELVRGKVSNAEVVISALEAADNLAVVTGPEQQTWLTFLNDVRLALGTRIGVTEDAMAELSQVTDDDPRLPMLLVYDWLTYVQGTLVEVLMLGLPDDGLDA